MNRQATLSAPERAKKRTRRGLTSEVRPSVEVKRVWRSRARVRVLMRVQTELEWPLDRLPSCSASSSS